MLKDYFLNKVENAINEAINAQKLGQMSEYTKGSLVVEKPKNPDFGDLAINVSSLARSARIAPPTYLIRVVDIFTLSFIPWIGVLNIIEYPLSSVPHISR